MSTPYPVGSRVVCPDPDDGWFVGTVLDVYDGVDLLVSDGVLTTRRLASEVRPVMPRGRDDVDRDRWWWRNDRPVFVTWTAVGAVWSTSPGWTHGAVVVETDDWRGPVQPPPVVRG